MEEHASWLDANMCAPTPILSVRAIRLSAPGRGGDIQVRISAPATGDNLPVIIFSHGYGSSMDGYAPLTDCWAAHGFVVIQPTHLDAKRLGLVQDDPRRPLIWRTRVEDMKRILDDLAGVTQSVPGLEGRVDHSLVAASGHSFGGQTTSMLLGARMLGRDGEGEDMSDRRVKAGILLASGGARWSGPEPLGTGDHPVFELRLRTHGDACFGGRGRCGPITVDDTRPRLVRRPVSSQSRQEGAADAIRRRAYAGRHIGLCGDGND
jgi:predicted dienelactone hydrolase